MRVLPTHGLGPGLVPVLLLALISACASTPATVPEPTPEPDVPDVKTPDDAESPAPPEPAATTEVVDDEFKPSDATADRWYTPLAPISLDPITDAEKADQQRCLDVHRIQADDVTDDELLAGLRCMGDDHGVTMGIKIAQMLVKRFPESRHVPAAVIAMGRGYERIERPVEAIEQYQYLLQAYPKHELARVVGQRSVCLARSLPLPDKERELLHQLERLYGRRGFEPPTPEQLVERCGE